MKIFLLTIIILLILAPGITFAQGQCTASYSNPTLCNAFDRLGVKDLQGFLVKSFELLAGIIASLLLAMLIYSGIRMILSQGDAEGVKTAKTSFTYSIIGFVVIIFGYVIVSMVQYFLGVRSGDPQRGSSFFYNPLSTSSPEEFIRLIVNNALGLIGALSVFFLVWNGFLYLTAGSNEEQTKKSKQAITWSIIGLITVVLSYTIVQVLISTFKN